MAQKDTNPNAADTKGLRSPVGQVLDSAREAFMGVGVFTAFINILMLTGPLYMLQVYDRVLASGSKSTLIAISIFMAAMFAFMGFLEFIRSRVLVRIADKFEQSLNDKTFTSWIKGSLKGGSAARATPLNDVATMKQFLSGNGPATFFDIPFAPLFIGVVFLLHWTLGILAIVGTVIIVISTIYNNKRTKTPQIEALKMRRMEQAFATQAQRNAETIEAMGMGENIRNRWKSFNTEGARESLDAADRSGGATSFTKSFRMFLQSAMLGAGGYLAIQQIITPGAMIAGSIILGRALAPVQMALGQWRGFGAARDAYHRLNEFYETSEEEDTVTQLPDPTGVLLVEQVTAAPPGQGKAVLSNLNFMVKPGQGLGVIGPSASGKSTLARMLVGVWMPQRGAIRLDGATFDQWDRGHIGKFIGYLPQTVEMFDGTIAENIARFDPNKTDEAVVEAAKWGGVHELILQLPEGYETKVGLGRTVLSGGQTQRIALARALYGDPVLIVMDEPNANLDPEGDAALTRAIAIARKRQKTVVVMAHRPSAIAAVDLILSLKDGTQEAFGPKEEVLKALKEQRQKQQEAYAAAKAGQTSAPAKPPASKPAPAGQPLGITSGAQAGRGFMMTGKPAPKKGK